MEGTHRELGAGLADGLSRDDADGFARVDRLADGQVDAVAPGADAALGLAGQDAADEDPVDAVGLEHLGVGGHEHVVGVEHDLAGGGVGDGHGGIPAVDADSQGLDLLALLIDGGGPDALGGAAVVLADDDVLGDVEMCIRDRSYSVSCCLTRSGLAPGISILFMATTMGMLAALAWLMDSMVCGMMPSFAATTRMAISVTEAPRARMEVKASWPGVSRKVIGLPLTFTV